MNYLATMKQLITLLFSIFSIGASAGDKQKEFRTVTLDPHGKVYYEQIYNVNKRSNMEILRYAVEFANDHGSPTSDKMIDQQKNEVSFLYTFPFKKRTDLGMGIKSLKAIITVGAKEERTRITVHDFTFTSDGPCKGGSLESILQCPGIDQGHVRGVERWMEEEVGERFFWEYKHFLEEAVTRPRSWD
jgi:hypothetical protein